MMWKGYRNEKKKRRRKEEVLEVFIYVPPGFKARGYCLFFPLFRNAQWSNKTQNMKTLNYMNRSMPQHKERLKQISILLTCPSSLLKKFPIQQNTNKMFCVNNVFPSVSLKTIYIFCLFLKTRVCLEGRFQNFMDIGDSKLKCLPARKDTVFVINRNSMKTNSYVFTSL